MSDDIGGHEPNAGTVGQERDPVSDFCSVGGRLERLPRERRHDFAEGSALKARQLLGGSNDIVVEIQGCSHWINITHHTSNRNEITRAPGVHGAIKEHYGANPDREITTTLDYVMAATGG